MRTIEERLELAADELRERLDGVAVAPVGAVISTHRRRRRRGVFATVAVAVGGIGLGGALVGRDPTPSLRSASTTVEVDSSPIDWTTVTGPAMETGVGGVPREIAAAVEGAPFIRIGERSGWQLGIARDVRRGGACVLLLGPDGPMSSCFGDEAIRSGTAVLAYQETKYSGFVAAILTPPGVTAIQVDGHEAYPVEDSAALVVTPSTPSTLSFVGGSLSPYAVPIADMATAFEAASSHSIDTVGRYSPFEQATIWSARIELATRCMTAQGYQLRWEHPTEAAFDQQFAAMLRHQEGTDIEQIRQYGYHRAPVAVPDPVHLPDVSGAELVAFSGADGRSGCLGWADQQIFGTGVGAFDAVVDAGTLVSSYAAMRANDPDILAARADWARCMDHAGFPTAAASAAEFRKAAGPTAEEIRQAVADAACRASAGVVTAIRAASATLITEWRAAHAAELDAAAAVRSEQVGAAQRVLTSGQAG